MPQQPNPLQRVPSFGQSLWLDFIQRSLIASGGLAKLIHEDGLRGMTSNPAIFEKAIAGSHDYDADIARLAGQGKDANAIYEVLAVRDVQDAADAFRGVYDATQALDGYVSLEVDPHLAHDTAGTLRDARRLWQVLDRPNVCIKVPATPAGIPAIRALIADGINVNVTLIFSIARYREVAEAFIAGLCDRDAAGKPVARIASVASFFISRIDALLDPQLDAHRDPAAKRLRGEIAIASAKLAYQAFLADFGTPRFAALAKKGARPQRLLWASTGTKDPRYSAVKYVDALIGPDTVNTVPVDTFNAYRTQGDPAARITTQVDAARAAIAALPGFGIDLAAATDLLTQQAVEKFNQPFDALMATLGKAVARAAA